jgi:ABC-2 type transport system ATP-binding protein
MKPMLTVRGLSKRYGTHHALDGVEFDIFQNEILGLIGPNGAGKTTLLEALAGLLPAEGVVQWAGHSVTPVERREKLFYLPDGVLPYADQRAAEVLAFFQEMHGRARADARRVVEELDLSAVLGKRVGELSKGTLKRLLLVVAFLSTQPLLLLDEPFDGLDLRQTRSVMALLEGLRKGGRTLLLSVHQLSDAERMCGRFLLLREGKRVGSGTLESLRKEAGLSSGGLEEVFLALA